MMVTPAFSNDLHLPRDVVYVLRVRAGQIPLNFHVVVRRTDLHCFVVVADIPGGGILRCFAERSAIFRCVLSADFVDWGRERAIYGESAWLLKRSRPHWRAIRRIEISKAGEVSVRDWFPALIATPILKTLENSVPDCRNGEQS